MNFPEKKYQVKTLVTKEFLSGILNILNNQTVLHLSHMIVIDMLVIGITW